MICHFSAEFNDFHDAVIHVVQEIQCSEITNFTEYVAVAMIEIWRGTSNGKRVDSNRQGPYPLYISLYFLAHLQDFKRTNITSHGLLLSLMYIFVSTDLPHNELFFLNTKIVGENPFMVSQWEKLRFHTLQVHLLMRKRMLTLHLPRSHLATSEWLASKGGRWRDLVDGIVGAKVAKVEIVISLIWCGGFSLLKFLVFIAGQLRRRRSAVWGWYS